MVVIVVAYMQEELSAAADTTDIISLAIHKEAVIIREELAFVAMAADIVTLLVVVDIVG